jgi:hypothetical protein
MPDLICFHKYIWGTIAADRSRWHSDGFASGVAAVAGGGLNFSTPQSRVEFVASSLQGGGTIIDADGCFRVSFTGPQTIVVQIMGYTLTVNIDGLPLGNWVNFNFWHDGVNQLDYGYGYEWSSGPGGPSGEGGGSASPTHLPGIVPPVGPKGICIGSQIGNPNAHLNGNISSVKIWRRDPEAMVPPFLGRPFTPPLLKCWGDLIAKFRQAADSDPECASWWSRLIEVEQVLLYTRLGKKSPDKLAELYQMAAGYQQLWSAGKVGSPEMLALMARLRDWLKSEGIFDADDPVFRQALQNPCMAKFTSVVGDLNCDPDAQALIKAIIGADRH